MKDFPNGDAIAAFFDFPPFSVYKAFDFISLYYKRCFLRFRMLGVGILSVETKPTDGPPCKI